MNKEFCTKLKAEYAKEIEQVEHLDTISKLNSIESFNNYSFVQLTYLFALVIDNSDIPANGNLCSNINTVRLINYLQLDENILKSQNKEQNMFYTIEADLLVPYLYQGISLGKYDLSCIEYRLQTTPNKADKELIEKFFNNQQEILSLKYETKTLSSNKTGDLFFKLAQNAFGKIYQFLTSKEFLFALMFIVLIAYKILTDNYLISKPLDLSANSSKQTMIDLEIEKLIRFPYWIFIMLITILYLIWFMVFFIKRNYKKCKINQQINSLKTKQFRNKIKSFKY